MVPDPIAPMPATTPCHDAPANAVEKSGGVPRGEREYQEESDSWVVPTILGGPTPLYLREEGLFLVIAKKGEHIGELLEQQNNPISPYMTVLWGWGTGLGNC